MNTQRDNTIDIMKGILIFFIVYAHTYGRWVTWVYLFNLPVFLMISGYCWNNRHSAEEIAARNYFFDRAKRLLVPYWICNYVFYFLHVLLQIGSSYLPVLGEVTGIHDPLPIRYIMSAAGIKNILADCYHILCFTYSPLFAGPSWYLHSLFMVCVLHCFLTYLLRNKGIMAKKIFMLLLFGIVCLAAWAFDSGIDGSIIAIRHQRIFAVYLCYFLGIGVRCLENVLQNKQCKKSLTAKKAGDASPAFLALFDKPPVAAAAAAAAFLMLCILDKFGAIEMSQCVITNPLFVMLTTLSGWIMLRGLAKAIPASSVSKFFCAIGRHTMGIVFLHCVAFKAVSAVYVFMTGRQISLIGSYPVIFNAPEPVKILYTCVGVLLPTALLCLLSAICNKK